MHPSATGLIDNIRHNPSDVMFWSFCEKYLPYICWHRHWSQVPDKQHKPQVSLGVSDKNLFILRSGVFNRHSCKPFIPNVIKSIVIIFKISSVSAIIINWKTIKKKKNVIKIKVYKHIKFLEFQFSGFFVENSRKCCKIVRHVISIIHSSATNLTIFQATIKYNIIMFLTKQNMILIAKEMSDYYFSTVNS